MGKMESREIKTGLLLKRRKIRREFKGDGRGKDLKGKTQQWVVSLCSFVCCIRG